jgi:hypothetical protein
MNRSGTQGSWQRRQYHDNREPYAHEGKQPILGWKTEKIELLNPIPSPSVKTAATVKPGDLRNCRTPYLRSNQRLSSAFRRDFKANKCISAYMPAPCRISSDIPTNSTNLVWAKHLFHPRESITKIHKLDLASVEQLPDEETIE